MTGSRRGLLLVLGLVLLGGVPFLSAAKDEAEEGEEEEVRTEPLPPLPWERPKQGEEACETEEILMLRDLRQRSLELDRREAVLEERTVALAGLEAEAAGRLDELDGLRTEVLALLEREQVATEDRVKVLAKMVDTMKAREAAVLLAGMDRAVAVLVLKKLKPKQAGKVLGAMPPEIAQDLGDRMTVLEDPRTKKES